MRKSYKRLVKPYLTTRKLYPENQETPIHFIHNWITPDELVYSRNHFAYPNLSDRAFFLPVDGEIEEPVIFQYADLLNMPSRRLVMTLECSGNQRAYFEPKVFGEQWEEGAISQGIWRGAPLSDLLNIARLKPSAKEIVFVGHDYGKRTDMYGVVPFARSLPLDKAIHSDTLVAYEYNGQPIPYKHGYPLRLIVPQWYGMASVKWLRRIIVIDHEFQGPFQVVDYNYYPYEDSDAGKSPVTTINVNSIVQQPLDYSILDTGIHQIQGIAWTGKGIITQVQISINGGKDWDDTVLQQDAAEPYAWTFWSYTWHATEKGEYTIMARAKDTFGRIQPFVAKWNKKGYGYNAVSSIKVKVE